MRRCRTVIISTSKIVKKNNYRNILRLNCWNWNECLKVLLVAVLPTSECVRPVTKSNRVWAEEIAALLFKGKIREQKIRYRSKQSAHRSRLDAFNFTENEPVRLSVITSITLLFNQYTYSAALLQMWNLDSGIDDIFRQTVIHSCPQMISIDTNGKNTNDGRFSWTWSANILQDIGILRHSTAEFFSCDSAKKIWSKIADN